MSPLLLCTIFSFSLLSITRAQGRPHGLAHANPMAFSPSAFEFFHPENHQPSALNPCVESGCSPLPIAATVQSNLAYASRSTTENKGSSGLGAGGVFGIIIGFAFAAFLAMGAYYIVAKRRENLCEKESADVEA